MSTPTFDLTEAVLASLDPIVERDPGTLARWADNLECVAEAFDVRGAPSLAAQKRRRAAGLRDLAGVAS